VLVVKDRSRKERLLAVKDRSRKERLLAEERSRM
jgi:hypothetical protein